MTHSFDLSLPHLQRLQQDKAQHLLAGGLKGLEKESLRINPHGRIAQTPHPPALGAALTHQYITTDYSEALMEFITPPSGDIQDALTWLQHIHQFVYRHLDDEILLSASMPCGIDGDASIPIAEYGLSNIGQMKHIYRRGLALRYGRTMQAIAGVHFNYSVPMPLWSYWHDRSADIQPLETFIARRYFDLIRNLLRHGWLVLYLFGASPAICTSFFKSRPQLAEQFDEFDDYTLYHPFATSLRMSDIGYKSENQARLSIDYNSLPGYVSSLSHAIETPYPPYQALGILEDGEYRQLNGNILQIENEFYSTVRPKQIAYSGEKPTLALKRRGVRYIELRSLDLDPGAPLGIAPTTAYFLEAFILTQLLQDSPSFTPDSWAKVNHNQLRVAHKGREPGLQLAGENGDIPLQDWANALLTAMQPVCEVLDQAAGSEHYQNALEQQQAKVENPDLTPSARMLTAMSSLEHPFNPYALNLSRSHAEQLRNLPFAAQHSQQFKHLAEASLARQQTLEQDKSVPFAEFLAHYFAQR
ncbi:MAG: glutamate--cysteine ligase [Methylococcales bacterium]|nr:glutamate--cysteine ligase [Methylococcales bacterium]